MQMEGSPQAASEADVDVEALQAEVAQLRQQAKEQELALQVHQHRGRNWAVGVLIVLGLLLLAVGNVTFWLRGTILNTDRWVAAVGPLSRNETVANAVSTYVVDSLFEAADVEQLIQQALPSEYSFLSGVLTGAVQNLSQETVTKLVQGDQFNAVWVVLNRAAHQAIMGVLRGKGDLLYLKDGQLTLDLSDLFGFVSSTLNLGNVPALQGLQTQFVLLASQQVAAVQGALAMIDTVGLLFPFLALGALFLAWLLSMWRRRTVVWIGIGIAVAMTLSLLVFVLTQPVVVASVVDPFARLLVGEIWDVVISGLYIQTLIVLVIGLLLVGGAALVGPSPTAVAIRTSVSRGWNKVRGH